MDAERDRLRFVAQQLPVAASVDGGLTFAPAVAYLLWAFVPEHILHAVHISYYPSKCVSSGYRAYLSVCCLKGVLVCGEAGTGLWQFQPTCVSW